MVLTRSVRCGRYDLVLSPDINTMGHTQWFFFSVTNMKPGVPYRFNIVNLEKANSQYNFGMQPVMYSERGAEEDGLGWHRVGAKVGYLKNSLRRDHPKKSTLFTATFTITFKYPGDTCYLACVTLAPSLLFWMRAIPRLLCTLALPLCRDRCLCCQWPSLARGRGRPCCFTVAMA